MVKVNGLSLSEIEPMRLGRFFKRFDMFVDYAKVVEKLGQTK
jgi:hypothetical protein